MEISGMVGGESAVGDAVRPQFMLMHVLSKVAPEHMARFMNSVTWMAGWLRDNHGWIRWSAGYALTDVPERVLEVYSIPHGDVERAEKVLRDLEAQHEEYRRLVSYCRQRHTIFMPQVKYQTDLHEFVEHSEVEARAGAAADREGMRRLSARQRGEKYQKDEHVRIRRRDRAKDRREKIVEELPEYFLYANIDVESARWEEFLQGMSRLIKDIDLKLAAAGSWSGKESKPIPGLRALSDRGVVHLWKLDDANAIYRQMVELRENERYSALTKCVAREWHMLMRNWEVVSRMRIASRDRVRWHKGGHPLQPDDLVLRAGNDWFYWLPAAQYRDKRHVAPDSVAQRAEDLVAKGVVMAGMRTSDGKGRAFLVNLSGLPRGGHGRGSARRKVAAASKKPDVPPLLGNEDLVILDRDGTNYYWVKKAEYQKVKRKLDRLDPSLVDQLRLLTNQGVVLADVPGGSIPEVKSMGCLVNLCGLQGFRAEQEEVESPPPSAPLLH